MNLKLKAAILIWRSGNPIATDHWFALADLGYNVARLEAKHSL